MSPHDPAPTPEELVVLVMGQLGTAAPTLLELGIALGLEGDPLVDLLEAAELAGLVQAWPDSPDGLAVTLTPEAAERAGLRLEEVHHGKGRFLFRWIPEGDPVPPERSRPKHHTIEASTLAGEDDRSDYMDRLADPKAREPHEASEFAERMHANLPAREQATRRCTKGEPVLRPIHLLGLREQWNEAEPGEGPCEGCGGKELNLLEVCLKCNRSGLDYLIPPLPKLRIRMLMGRAKEEVLAGGMEKAKKPPAKAPKTAKRRGAPAKSGRAKATKAKLGA